MKCNFSQNHFLDIINKLKIMEFKFYSYTEVFKKFPDHPFIILRHDIDHSLDCALKLAKIEHNLDISSTFFILLHSEFYPPSSAQSIKIIREISKLGHQIGLHYDTSFYNKYHKNPITGMKKDIQILNDITGEKITVGCHHNVIDSILDKKFRKILPIDVCSPIFFKKMTYISDSAMKWRQNCICKMLDNIKHLHLTLHPIYWTTPGNTMLKKFKFIAEYESKKINKTYLNTYKYYQECLKQRITLDKKVAKHFKKQTNPK